MAVNKPVGDNARKGAVKKRTQLKAKLGGVTAWTSATRHPGSSWPWKRPPRRKRREEIQGVRREKTAGK